jgi:hypothetical protein
MIVEVLPPRSPHAIPCDYFIWGCVEDRVYVLPLTTRIRGPKVRIISTIETFTVGILKTVWNELDYRVDVCRITNGAHIEHL